MHVHCCLSLSLLWEPSTSAVSTLWEYYSKNLVNKNLQGNTETRGCGDGRCVTDCKRSVILDISSPIHIYLRYTVYRFVLNILWEFFNTTFSAALPTTECFILHTVAWSVCCGHFVQDANGSAGSGSQLLLSVSPPLARTHPAVPCSQLLPHLPASAGPVPRPGWGWGSPTETDQREVRLVRRQGGFKVLASSQFTPWKVGLVSR